MVRLFSRGRRSPLDNEADDSLGTRRRESVSLGGRQRKWFSRLLVIYFLKITATNHPITAAAGTTMIAIWSSLQLQLHSGASLLLISRTYAFLASKDNLR